MPLLETRGLSRKFPGVLALDNVDFSADAGEVHAIVGANGAGKSTLMNLLAGVLRPSDGNIMLNGAEVRLNGPISALSEGIACVYQEFSLVPQLSVARNIFLGKEPKNSLGLVGSKHLMKQAQGLLDEYDVPVSADVEAGTLSVAEQQMVEIVRALSHDPQILILDEPTAVLSISEKNRLFSTIQSLKNRGILVLYVSHFLGEVIEIADRVTVIRDGQIIGTVDARETSVDGLVEMMLGRAADQSSRMAQGAIQSDGPCYRITYGTGTEASDINIAPGEVVGLAGLVGSGRSQFARAAAGLANGAMRAEVSIGGRPLANRNCMDAIQSRIVYVTKDRKADGLFANLGVLANTSASILPALSSGQIIGKRREREVVTSILESLKLVSSSIDQKVSELSGGNQQKVLLARAFLTEPQLIICDEPTRGVDVGAKAEIHRVLRDLAQRGVAVLVISSENEELLRVADKIVVMRDRIFVTEFDVKDVTEADVLIASSGATVN